MTNQQRVYRVITKLGLDHVPATELLVWQALSGVGEEYLLGGRPDQAKADIRTIQVHMAIQALRYIEQWWDECGFDGEWDPTIKRRIDKALEVLAVMP